MVDFKRYKTGFFSMEIGIDDSIPTYAGGLGVLAGDALKSCADLKLPVIGISLLYSKGYFRQKIDEQGNQTEEEQQWDPGKYMEKLDNRVKIKIKGEDVTICCWMHEIEGIAGSKQPVLFLDTDIEGNSEYFRNVCHRLYQGDRRDRVAQEMILGIGGVEMLKSLGCNIRKYHLNEGHTSFLTLALYRDSGADDKKKDLRGKCIFTTHTPIPAGHDEFDEKLVRDMAGDYIPEDIDIFDDGVLNMTRLGLMFSGYINGVARKHRKVSKQMFPEHDIESITNGIHARSWTSEPFRKLFDEHVPEWYEDPFSLRSALNIPEENIWDAHVKAKKSLIKEVKEKTGIELDIDRLTIGFARRFVQYKRPDLIFHDLDRLKSIAHEKGDIQIVFSGKAHPGDPEGKRLIKEIVSTKKKLEGSKIKVVFLEDYGIRTAKLMTAGCDVWLNNPRRPHEASGTSGMKASVNGVPHFSTLDGWWLEGHIEGMTGWCIGLHPKDPEFDKDVSPDDEAEDFYSKLDGKVLPMFYRDKGSWRRMMRTCIAINGSFFNTHRMMQQYVMEAYFK